ncbi:hypothetical protein BRADI_5g13750v3 [Brachypodium distachyon]|uniref:Serine-threonine/tyrosine-protein kinase catalytic domain-containing protein n=1 Tax=Brachypodium distachyon TaxID=15368 RepID=I1IYZ5_BRADI|nr:hypothetical protein BRADI_5g13750v3 [Brachypodium distachyon]
MDGPGWSTSVSVPFCTWLIGEAVNEFSILETLQHGNHQPSHNGTQDIAKPVESYVHTVAHCVDHVSGVFNGAARRGANYMSGLSARLGDFGLARLYEHAARTRPRRASSARWATWPAPELAATGKVTAATDVFAFSGLLLEAACGRWPIDPATGVNLVRLVRDHGVQGDLVRRRGREARRVVRQGAGEAGAVAGPRWLACSQWRPDARPSTRQVCHYLDGEEDVQEDAVLVFSDADSVAFGSLTSLRWSSCATMLAGSLHGGR